MADLDLTVVGESVRRDRRRGTRRNLNLWMGTVLLMPVAGMTLVSVFWTPLSPALTAPSQRLLGVGSPGHLLGTDHLGRDEVSMLMAGALSSFQIAVLGTLFGVLVGVGLGGLSAMAGRWVDDALMRLSDVLFAFPSVILAMVLAAGMGAGKTTVVIAISLAVGPAIARLVRSVTAQVLHRDFIAAARGYGRGRAYIFVRHVLPNISSALIVTAATVFSSSILTDASLSYLGVGTQPPGVSWGRMLNDAQAQFAVRPLLAIWPGLIIVVCVLGLSLIGDGLRDRFDVKGRARL
jgi:peptide/nickel transport system permease protein